MLDGPPQGPDPDANNPSSSARRKSGEGKQGGEDEVRRADSSDDGGAVRADRPRPPGESFASPRESVCAVPDVQRENKTDDGEGYRAKPHALGRQITSASREDRPSQRRQRRRGSRV